MSKEPIFLNISSSSSYLPFSQKYIFVGNRGGVQYETQEIYRLIDPSIDTTFRFLFAGNDTKLLENMLNSILFPDSAKLSEIQILNDEVVRPNPKYRGTIRADLVCIAKLDQDHIISSIEMQIVIYGDFTKRLLNSDKGLNNNSDYEISWSLGLSINVTNIQKYSSYNDLNKIQNGEKKELNFLNDIEINLNEEIIKINQGEDIYINNKKVGIYGKEWIKFFGLRTWCPQNFSRFILPKTYNLSNNKYFIEVINKLENIPTQIINESLSLETDLYYLTKEIKNAILEGKIQSAFKLFKEGCENKCIIIILGNEKFKKDNVKFYLEEFKEVNDTIEKFLLFLKDNKYLLDE